MIYKLHMNPNVDGIPWEQFCQETGPFSIAIDSYVHGGTRFDSTGPRLNIDHHEEVDRLATRSACEQALLLMRQGLPKRFRDESGYHVEIYANHPDEDVCLTCFIFKHCYLAEQVMNPALNRLVQIEGTLDTTCGAFPYPVDLPILRQIAWVFEPYRRAKLSGELYKGNADTFQSIISDVESRIWKHIVGDGDAIDLDTRYNQIGGGKGWILIEEIGAHARTGAFANGHSAFVSIHELENGNRKCTAVRMSSLVPFDMPRFVQLCNEKEGLVDAPSRWGGGGNFAGSPRPHGTALPLETIVRITNEVTL